MENNTQKKIPDRIGNRASRKTYTPSSVEANCWNQLNETEKQILLEVSKLKRINKRLGILKKEFPKDFFDNNTTKVFTPHFINVLCYSHKMGRSNIRRTLSNYYNKMGFYNVTSSGYSGMIFSKTVIKNKNKKKKIIRIKKTNIHVDQESKSHQEKHTNNFSCETQLIPQNNLGSVNKNGHKKFQNIFTNINTKNYLQFNQLKNHTSNYNSETIFRNDNNDPYINNKQILLQENLIYEQVLYQDHFHTHLQFPPKRNLHLYENKDRFEKKNTKLLNEEQLKRNFILQITEFIISFKKGNLI
ncbi:hypothetical protein M0813_09809 [Anaeramoeba flamelloides]|uniref:Uncharacterized protein n=1 Tax=Anaeramoeba flamelloides TaxID=1746091 RepID=A0ABQ8X5R6_9EUKA|nr:hypothetical protein M0813_09809 [Anaeramoeba flamelloides]